MPLKDGSLGSDKSVLKTGAVYLAVLVILTMLNWMVANSTIDVKETANFYMILGLIFFGAFTADFVVKKTNRQFRGADIPDTVTYESESPLGFKMPRWAAFAIVIGSVLLGAWIFFNVGTKPTMSIVSAPTFAAVDLGSSGSAFLSGLAGIVEDMFFWGFIGPTLFGVALALSGKKLIGLAAAWGVTPFIFMIYHIGRKM